MLKIITGKYKNRTIPVLKNAKYRPSTSKFKEAVFSILSSGEFMDNKLFHSDCNVLDLFCGSGSLGFEALSRGCGSVTFIDINVDYLKSAKEFAGKLGELDKTYFVNLDALSLPKATKSFDLIFADPPYRNNVLPNLMEILIKNQWLKAEAILVVETSKVYNYKFNNMAVIKEKTYGNSKLLILRYQI